MRHRNDRHTLWISTWPYVAVPCRTLFEDVQVVPGQVQISTTSTPVMADRTKL